jgi:hypothetical protein
LHVLEQGPTRPREKPPGSLWRRAFASAADDGMVPEDFRNLIDSFTTRLKPHGAWSNPSAFNFKIFYLLFFSLDITTKNFRRSFL